MDHQREVSRDISGYEGLYTIDCRGNIYSMKKKIKLAPGNNGIGYLQIGLYKDGKHKNHYVHRLVAEAFIPNPENCPVVNHKDGNKQNNCVENLEWCTQKENIEESIRLNLQRNINVYIDNIFFSSLRRGSKFLGKYPNYLSLMIKKNGTEFNIGGKHIKVVMDI